MSSEQLTAKTAWPELSVSSVIQGSGFFLPERVVPNSYFESYLETSDEWISERTGIRERRWVEEGVTVSELAEPASRDAIKASGLDVSDIDGIVFATVTPDKIFPSSACALQKRLGIENGFAFDINAVCSGFIYALATADSLIAQGVANNILVIGADIFSKLVDRNDRGTCILFGDGAGAVVLSKAKQGSGSSENLRGVYKSILRSDGSGGDILEAQEEGKLTMAGREVFKLAVRALGQISIDILESTGLSAAQVDFFASHQANQRILDAMAKQLNISNDKVLSNIANYGNTSAATVPILLAEAALDNVIKQGDLVLLSAFGGGVTWGAVLLRW